MTLALQAFLSQAEEGTKTSKVDPQHWRIIWQCYSWCLITTPPVDVNGRFFSDSSFASFLEPGEGGNEDIKHPDHGEAQPEAEGAANFHK